MFETMKKSYSLEAITTIKSPYGEELKSFTEIDKIKAFITLSSHDLYSSNDMRINQCTHIGLTRAKGLKKGMRIGGKYIIEFVDARDDEVLIYLKEVENNGYNS